MGRPIGMLTAHEGSLLRHGSRVTRQPLGAQNWHCSTTAAAAPDPVSPPDARLQRLAPLAGSPFPPPWGRTSSFALAVHGATVLINAPRGASGAVQRLHQTASR